MRSREPKSTRRPWRAHPLLRRLPDSTQDYTESHLGRGADYDEGFATLPMRRLLWQLQQQAVAELLGDLTAAREGQGLRVLDVACGTGRLTAYLSRLLPQADVTGVDVAASMLDVARRRAPGARFVHADVRRLGNVMDDGTADLVTAFRFFANADAALRAATVSSVVRVLRPGGLLLIDNHRGFWSPSYLTRRARGRSGAPGARNRDVLGPFLDAGLVVEAHRSLGVLPHADEGPYLVPQAVVTRCERFNQRHLSAQHTLGTTTMWLVRKPRG